MAFQLAFEVLRRGEVIVVGLIEVSENLCDVSWLQGVVAFSHLVKDQSDRHLL